MYLARPTRFERVTAWFVARYSIQLSYGRVEGRYYREEGVLSQGLGRISELALIALIGAHIQADWPVTLVAQAYD